MTAVEDKIREQWVADIYTAESPFVVVNPYEIAPLSALVMFEIEEPVTVTYHVEGVTEDTTISNSVEESNTVQELPVLGLYVGFENTVRLELNDGNGNNTEHYIQIETEPISENYYELKLIESQPNNMHSGLTFLNSSTGEYTAVDEEREGSFILNPWMGDNVEHLDNGNIIIVLRREHDE